jgi:hypothetical protein
MAILTTKAPSGRSRKFKLYSNFAVKKLREGYMKAYKKNGCRYVKFYLRGVEVSDDSTIGSLGLTASDRIIAMENGRKL